MCDENSRYYNFGVFNEETKEGGFLDNNIIKED